MIRRPAQHSSPGARNGKHSSRQRKKRGGRSTRRSSSNGLLCAVIGLTALIVGLMFIWLSTTAAVMRDNAGGGATSAGDSSGGAGRAGPAEPRSLRDERKAQKNTDAVITNKNDAQQQRISRGSNGVKSAPTSQVLAVLLRLARRPSKELRIILESSNDPFHLAELQKGQCPWRDGGGGKGDTVVEWLPERPLLQPSEWFRNRGEKNSHHPPVAIYYEHLSKAGGTSFCKLAQSNMPKAEVPRYYCMPSEPGMSDARVGSWERDKLLKYFAEKPHRLVSNEWEPFNLDFLELQIMSDTDLAGGNKDGIYLMFVTSIRNPINRLLSAYRFWGQLHNQAKIKPSLETWLQRYGRRAKRWQIKSQDFNANVGRFNFATWKFSGGSLPVPEIQIDAEKNLSPAGIKRAAAAGAATQEESIWRQSFETAVNTLAKFDLAIPMELLSAHTDPIQHLLGWNKFDQSHVVPSGNVMNNDASSELSTEEYDLLWDANKLDMILYYWTCAIYLARLNCADVFRA